MPRLPPWLRSPIRTGRAYGVVQSLTEDLRLRTVCRSAQCPNRHACWSDGGATFMVLGPSCTRGCRFCSVPTGAPPPPDPEEPGRIGEAVQRLGLNFSVITMVTRDDLPDGGAAHMAECVRAIRRACPNTGVEVLASDFGGDPSALDRLLEARPNVFAHNVETVQRLQCRVRDLASYPRSLEVLRRAAEHATCPAVKSGLMLGMGETEPERLATLRDLRESGCHLITLGQYLAPGPAYWPVAEYVPPDQFEALGRHAREMGFLGVASGPKVRSSYKAGELFATVKNEPPPESQPHERRIQ